jgi:hypothetical protein
VAAYADDVTLYVTGANMDNLKCITNIMVKDVVTWCKSNGMIVSSKTKFLAIRARHMTE